MLTEYRDSYHSKFSDPFCAYLHQASIEGGNDDAMGDAVDGPAHLSLLGRHVLIEDSQGFVCRDKLDDRGDTLQHWAEHHYPGVLAWDQEQPEDW